MAGVKAVLDAIIGRSPLNREEGPRLYRYRLRPAERRQLEHAVRQRRRLRSGWDVDEAAGAALLAACNLCQHHESGPWQWQTALGFKPDRDLVQQIRAALTNYWHLPEDRIARSRSGDQVLDTLGREGGLPRSLLTSTEAQLGKILRRALRAKERLPHTETVDLVKEDLHRLPPGRQNDDIAEILAELVDAIATLRADRGNALATEASLPEGWEQALPLDFDAQHEEAVRALVLDLMRTPVAVAEAIPFEFTLHLKGDRVLRQLRLEPVSAAAVSARFKDDDTAAGSPPPNRGRLLVEADDGMCIAVATLTLAGDHYRIRDERRPDLGLASDLCLVLEAGGRRWIWATPPGGEAPSPDEPWVFTDDDAGRWLGNGSVSTREASVRVVCPFDWPLPTEAEALGQVSLGSGETTPTHQLGRLRHEVTLLPPGETEGFRIRPGVGAEAERWSLSGHSRRLGGRGTRVWDGDLKAERQNDAGRRSREHVQYAYLGEPGDWETLDVSDTAYGPLWVRVVRAGAVCFRRKIVRVPPDFEIQVEPRADTSGDLYTSAPAELTLRDPDGAWEQVSPQRIRVSVGDPPPDLVRLQVKLPRSKPFEVTVPAPVRQAAILGLDRKPVDPATPLAVDRLGGIRARVFDPLGPARQRVTLVAEAGRAADRGREIWDPIPDGPLTVDLPRQRDGVWALGLDEIEDDLKLLLARAGHLDGELRLSIEVDGRPQRTHHAVIRQYPRKLKVDLPGEDEPGPRVPRFIHLKDGSPDEVALTVRPIGSPDHPGIPLPRARIGWLWPEAARQDGAWLITGTERGYAREISAVRPSLVPVRGTGNPPAEPTGDLARAIAVSSREERRARLQACFDALAADPNHPDWPLLHAHLESLSWLPAVTYDVVVDLADHPGALALATLQRGAGLHPLISGLETLPFAWWQIPPTAWCAALRAQATLLFDAVPSLAPRLLTAAIDTLKAEGGLFSGIASLLRDCMSPPPPAQSPLREAIGAAFDQVLRHEAQWPRLSDGIEALTARLGAPRDLLQHLPRDTSPEKRDVLAAPLLAAWIACHAVRLETRDLIALRRLRAFDRDWFDHTWSVAVVRFHADPPPAPTREDAR